jgi:hypothetical protein
MPAVALEDCAKRTSTSSTHARVRVRSYSMSRCQEAQHLRTLAPKPNVAISFSGAHLAPTTSPGPVPSTTRARQKKRASQYIISFEKKKTPPDTPRNSKVWWYRIAAALACECG